MHSHYTFEKHYNEIKRQRLNKARLANKIKSYSPNPFTIWTEKPKPIAKNTVFRFAIASGVTVLQLQNDLEKLGYFMGENSFVEDSQKIELKKLSDLYK